MSHRSLRDRSSVAPPVEPTMTPTRKAPHCRTCHKPLKGHKRGVCDTTPEPEPLAPPARKPGGRKSAPLPDTTTTSPTPGKKPVRGRKSAPLPMGPLPTLSPQSSQVLNNLLRTNSHSSEPTFHMPGALCSPPSRDVETLHVALSRLSANDKPSPGRYTPTEVEETEAFGSGEEPGLTQESTHAVSQQLGLAVDSGSDSDTSTLAPRTAQRHDSGEAASNEMTIQNFLDSTAQSSHHPPATIFSFPAQGVTALEDGARRLGLFVHVLPLPSANELWVPVVVGRDARAVKKLLEDSEKLAQAVGKSGNSNVGDFRVGMGHIVAGTLGALATWAGLAYT